MANKPKTPMPVQDRAKQFMPFAALKGLPQALAGKEKILADKIELTEDSAAELDILFHRISPGDIITVTYFYHNEYLKLTGIVARLDKTSRILQIVNTKIPFDDVLKLEL